MVAACAHAGNPIVPGGLSIADPHIRIFDDVAYMYAGRDASRDSGPFNMPDWSVWRSSDLVNWEHTTTILPTQTYIGDRGDNACWATDVVRSPTNSSRFAFFFSFLGLACGFGGGLMSSLLVSSSKGLKGFLASGSSADSDMLLLFLMPLNRETVQLLLSEEAVPAAVVTAATPAAVWDRSGGGWLDNAAAAPKLISAKSTGLVGS